MGIDLGYLDHKPQSSSLNLEVLPHLKSVKGQKSTKASAKRDLAQFFNQCKNKLHIATLVLSDRDLTRKASTMATLSEGGSRSGTQGR